MARPTDISKKMKKTEEVETVKPYVWEEDETFNKAVEVLKENGYKAGKEDKVLMVRIPASKSVNKEFYTVEGILNKVGYIGSWGVGVDKNSKESDIEDYSITEMTTDRAPRKREVPVILGYGDDVTFEETEKNAENKVEMLAVDNTTKEEAKPVKTANFDVVERPGIYVYKDGKLLGVYNKGKEAAEACGVDNAVVSMGCSKTEELGTVFYRKKDGLGFKRVK